MTNKNALVQLSHKYISSLKDPPAFITQLYVKRLENRAALDMPTRFVVILSKRKRAAVGVSSRPHQGIITFPECFIITIILLFFFFIFNFLQVPCPAFAIVCRTLTDVGAIFPLAPPVTMMKKCAAFLEIARHLFRCDSTK